MDAHHADSLLRACEQLIRVRRLDLAERELRRLLSLHPHHAEAHSLLGWCLAAQKRPAEALQAAREAVRLAPGMAHAHRVLASVQIEADRPRDAERSIRAALELAPAEAEYYAVLATALLNQPLRLTGRAALRAADAGLGLNPWSVECARLRALALMRLLRRKEARAAAEYALSLDPEGAEAHATAGMIELALGTRSRSREHLRQALRIDPTHTDAERDLRAVTPEPPFGVALVVRTGALLPRLLWIAAVFAVETIVLARTDPADLPSLAILTGLYFLGLSIHVPWALLRHRRLIRELRAPGGMSQGERKDADLEITIMLAFPLILPLVLLMLS
jgi:tetratricopeptide (TPR) repeat protein